MKSFNASIISTEHHTTCKRSTSVCMPADCFHLYNFIDTNASAAEQCHFFPFFLLRGGGFPSVIHDYKGPVAVCVSMR